MILIFDATPNVLSLEDSIFPVCLKEKCKDFDFQSRRKHLISLEAEDSFIGTEVSLMHDDPVLLFGLGKEEEVLENSE